MKKGFTLIELLAVIIILGIILIIAIPNVQKIINQSRRDVYLKNEKKIIEATKEYLMNNLERRPNEIGNTSEITLAELINSGLINKFKDQKGERDCNGYILVTKISADEYDYTPHLNCVNDIGSSSLDGLVGHWKLDGNALDYSLNNNHGTISGATSINDKFGNENKAFNFDGVNDYIKVSMSATNIKALSLWVKVDSIPSDSRIIFVHKPSAIGLGFYQGNSFILKSGSATETSRRSGLGIFKVGEWNYIVINYDSSGIPTIFINGVETDTYLSSNYWAEAENDMYIARRTIGTNFAGDLDDIRIYNRQLDIEEIGMIYGNEFYKMKHGILK